MNIKFQAILFALAVPLCGFVTADDSALPKAPAESSGSQQQARTTMMGTRDQQFYIAKITVSDLEKSYKFYTDIIGLKTATSPGRAPTSFKDIVASWKAMNIGFIEIPLNFTGSMADPIFVLVQRDNSEPSRETAKLTWIGFKVANARKVVTSVAAAGYPVIGEPAERGYGIMAFVEDPDGYTVEFIQSPSYPAN